MNLFDLAESRRLKEAGQIQAELTASLWANDWVGKARYFAIQHARLHGTVTSDDIHRICPMPDSVHPNSMGAIWRTKELVCVGYTVTQRKSGHARRIGIYKPA